VCVCVCVCMCKLCKYSKTENYQSNENCTDLTDKQKQLLTDIQVTMYEPSPWTVKNQLKMHMKVIGHSQQ
jgi:hypothetical protein